MFHNYNFVLCLDNKKCAFWRQMTVIITTPNSSNLKTITQTSLPCRTAMHNIFFSFFSLCSIIEPWLPHSPTPLNQLCPPPPHRRWLPPSPPHHPPTPPPHPHPPQAPPPPPSLPLPRF